VVDSEALMVVNVLDALGVIAGIAAMLATLVAVWYAIGWSVGLFLRWFPLTGRTRGRHPRSG
jgi:hypothetical protein